MNAKCLFMTIGLVATLCGRAQTLDPTFGTGGIVETYYGLYVESKVLDMLLQPDGKIVVCGTTYVNSYDFMMIRYLEDGSLDQSFGDNGKSFVDFGSTNNYGLGYALQSDGKIIAVGYSETPNYESISIARFNADGSIDTGFGVDGIVYQTAGDYESFGFDVVIQSDGKILVSGKGYYTPQGEDFFLARYNQDGSLDTSFGTGGIVENVNDLNSGNGPVLTLQSDGKIILAGMGGAGGQQHYCTMRFLPNGDLDETYSEDGNQLTLIPGDYNWPGNVLVQPDDKIVVAGYSGYWQNELFSIIRLNADGNLDTDFADDGAFTYSINQGLDLLEDVILQPDGKILACGYTISTTDGYDFVALRLNPDGTMDTSFGENGILNQPFSYSESRAAAMAIQPDGKLLIAGDAPDFLNHHTAVARYDAGIPAVIDENISNSNTIVVYPNPASTSITMECALTASALDWMVFDMQGKLIYCQLHSGNKFRMDIDHLVPGMYLVRAVDSQGICFQKSWVKE